MDTEEAITSRRSIRRFLPKPVPVETVADILDVSARAPSGTNMQPWKVYVVTGDAKESRRRTQSNLCWSRAINFLPG